MMALGSALREPQEEFVSYAQSLSQPRKQKLRNENVLNNDREEMRKKDFTVRVVRHGLNIEFDWIRK